MIVSARPRAHENAWIWLAKVLSGVLIFALLVVHLVINHLVASGGLLSYADVLAYYAHAAVPVMEGAFLVFVVSHALLGLRGIVLDLSPPARLVRALDILLVGGGALAIGYGLWLLRMIALRAAGA